MSKLQWRTASSSQRQECPHGFAVFQPTMRKPSCLQLRNPARRLGPSSRARGRAGRMKPGGRRRAECRLPRNWRRGSCQAAASNHQGRGGGRRAQERLWSLSTSTPSRTSTGWQGPMNPGGWRRSRAISRTRSLMPHRCFVLWPYARHGARTGVKLYAYTR